MDKFYFVTGGDKPVEIELSAEHPCRVKTDTGHCLYSAECFMAGAEIECWLNDTWVKGVLDTEVNKAYNRLRTLEAIRSVQLMNRPKLFVVR
jgi:hypothetical protein